MRKGWIIGLLSLSFLFILSACGSSENGDNNNKNNQKVKYGISEMTPDEFIKKKDNGDAFYTIIVNGTDEELKQTKFAKAYDKAFKVKDIKGYYINTKNLDDKGLELTKRLDKEYSQRKSGYEPFSYGGIVVVHEGLIDVPDNYYGNVPVLYPFQKMIKKDQTFLDDEYYDSNIMDDVEQTLDFANDKKIKTSN